MSKIARAVSSVVVLAGAFIPCVVAAQRPGDITVGIMAGVNYTKVTQDPDPGDVTLHYKAGFVGGGFLGYQVADVFSIEPQVLFSQKGTKVEGTGSNSSLEGSVRINYIAVPILGKFWIPVSDPSIKPFVFIGPEIAFKVSCKAEGVILAVTGSQDCDNTEVIKVKSTDFGGTAGGGIQFRAGNQIVRVDGRYTLGFTNINDGSGTDNRDIKNRAFSATIGLGWAWPR